MFWFQPRNKNTHTEETARGAEFSEKFEGFLKFQQGIARTILHGELCESYSVVEFRSKNIQNTNLRSNS